jgi:hypothetical protein
VTKSGEAQAIPTVNERIAAINIFNAIFIFLSLALPIA